MKSILKTLIFLSAIASHTDLHSISAQPAVAQDSVSRPIPEAVMIEIERLYSPVAADRIEAAYRLGELDAAGLHVIPFLIEALGDRTRRVWVASIRKDTSPYLEAREALTKIGEPAVQRLVAAIQSCEGPSIEKYEMITTLVKIGKASLEPLIRLLEDADDWTRKEIVGALGWIGDARAVDPLIDLLQDLDPNIRSASAEALGRICDPIAGDHLLESVQDESELVRASAISALDYMGLLPPVEMLLPAMNDESHRVRDAAARLLIKTRDDRVVTAFLQAFKDLCYGSTSGTIAWALKQVKDQRAAEGVASLLGNSRIRKSASKLLSEMGAVAVEPVVRLLNDKDAEIRMSAVEILGKIGDPRAIEPLISRLKDQARTVASKAAQALGEIGDEQALPELVKTFTGRELRLKLAAAEALGKIKSREAVLPLIKMLTHPFIESQVPWALGEIGDPRAVEPLVDVALHHRDDAVRRAAMEAVVKLNGPAATALIKALEDDSLDIRGRAALILGRIGKPAVKDLIGALEHTKAPVRTSAAKVLHSIADRRAVPALINALIDENWEVRQWAAYGLGRIKDPSSWQPLIQALEDENWQVRRAAASGLGHIKDRKAVKALVHALEDDNWAVRAEVVSSLGEMKDLRAVGPLISALRSRERPVELSKFVNRMPPEPWKYSEREARIDAISALSFEAQSRLFEAAVAASRDEEWYVRREIVKALGELGDSRGTELLMAALKDPYSTIRSAAAKALGKIDDPRVAQALFDALSDDDQTLVCPAAAESLKEAMLRSLAAELKELSGSSSASKMLPASKLPRAIEVLILNLQHQNEYVRATALEILRCVPYKYSGLLNHPCVVRSVTRLLHDDSASVRKAAVVVLSRTTNPCQVNALLERLRDDVQSVRGTTRTALEGITGKTLGQDYSQWRDWLDELNQRLSSLRMSAMKHRTTDGSC